MCGKSPAHYAEYWRAVQELWLRLYLSNLVLIAAINVSVPAPGGRAHSLGPAPGGTGGGREGWAREQLGETLRGTLVSCPYRQAGPGDGGAWGGQGPGHTVDTAQQEGCTGRGAQGGDQIRIWKRRSGCPGAGRGC